MRTRTRSGLALRVSLALAVSVPLAASGAVARAQGYGGGAASRYVTAEPDLFRRYGASPAVSRTAGTRPYQRPRPRRPAPPPSPPARTPAPHAVHDYFPGMRSGQSPNHNTVNTRHLCVPGRRALIVRPQRPSSPAGSGSAAGAIAAWGGPVR